MLDVVRYLWRAAHTYLAVKFGEPRPPSEPLQEPLNKHERKYHETQS